MAEMDRPPLAGGAKVGQPWRGAAPPVPLVVPKRSVVVGSAGCKVFAAVQGPIVDERMKNLVLPVVGPANMSKLPMVTGRAFVPPKGALASSLYSSFWSTRPPTMATLIPSLSRQAPPQPPMQEDVPEGAKRRRIIGAAQSGHADADSGEATPERVHALNPNADFEFGDDDDWKQVQESATP